MALKVGVGKSQEPEGFDAGAEAAKKALEAAGLETADFVLVTATIGFEHKDLLAGVRSVTKEAPLVGCSGLGVITQEGPDETLRRVVVTVFSSKHMVFKPVTAHGLKADSYKVGEELASQLNEDWPDKSKVMLLFTDGLTVNPVKLFAGLEDHLKFRLPFVGGTAGETLANQHTFQYFNDEVMEDSAIAVVLAGDFDFDIGVSHGSVSMGVTRTITKAEGNHVYEIDNKPAFEVFKEFLGDDVKELTATTVNGLSFGVETPEELHGEYEDYMVRIPLVLDKSDNSLFMSAEWPVGTKLAICRRDPERVVRRSTEISTKLRDRHAGQNPAFVLQFECAGRSKALIGVDTAKKDVEVTQAVFDRKTPWFGFYTYGEIAPIKDKNEYHNWTSVVFAIYA
jgi:hypothetical protein